MILPEHMDIWSRNERLYQTLKGMGLFVSPIPDVSDPLRIAGMVVSAGLVPEDAAENTAKTGIGLAVERPQVADVIAPAESGRENVINLPAVR
jgi:hypothetical protein